jgi:hypothetical protein
MDRLQDFLKITRFSQDDFDLTQDDYLLIYFLLFLKTKTIWILLFLKRKTI